MEQLLFVFLRSFDLEEYQDISRLVSDPALEIYFLLFVVFQLSFFQGPAIRGLFKSR